MIRPADVADATQVAPLFILSMGHIAGIFANSQKHEDATPFFADFFARPANQYSYENTLVFDAGSVIAGSVTGYDGALLSKLREPVLAQIRKTRPEFIPEDETEPGEYYLDCIHVHPAYQGQGIGKKLITAFCAKARELGFKKAGLIVDMLNPKAKQFYELLGFQVEGVKPFMGHEYYHMTYTII
jgi:ribosomal protein S18 acetylase RimI-like enzyme